MSARVTNSEWRTIADLYDAGEPAAAVAEEFGVTTGTVLNYVRKAGLQVRRCGPPRRPGKGSVHLDLDGYAMTTESGCPIYEAMVAGRQKRGAVRRGRLVLGQHLGRVIEPWETVHHKNGDRLDDRPENLEIRQGAHGRGVTLKCAGCGSHDLEPA